MWWSDGREYQETGEFADGKKHGEGVLRWPDGRSYNGQWCDGRQHGTAVACTAQGMRRESRWLDGRFIEWLGEIIEDFPRGRRGAEAFARPGPKRPL
ncbi:unnamed protein product, partial [Prorocentrum cordatum]